jgi:hypothetical protein
MRRLLLIAVVVILVVAALFVAAAVALDPDALRGPLEELASERLKRPVALGEMRLDLLPMPTVRVADVRVGGERAGDPPLAEVAEIRLRPALLPLLVGRVVIRTLEVRAPVVRLALDAGGRPVPPDLAAGTPSTGEDRSSAPLLAVDSIRVESGRVEAGPWRVENLAIDGVLRLEGTASLDLEADLPGLARLRDVHLVLEGLLGAERAATVEGRLVDADLAALSQRLGYELSVGGRASGSFTARVEADELVAAALELDVEDVELESETFSLRGRVSLRAELGGPFTLELGETALELGESIRKPAGAALRATGTLPARIPPRELEEIELWVGPNRIPLRVDLADPPPRVTIAPSTLELEPLRDWLVDPPDGLAGRLEIETLTLRTAPFAAAGRVRLADVSFALENGTIAVSGPVDVNAVELVADPLEVRLGGQSLRATARYPLVPATSTFTLSAERAQLGPLAEALTGKREVDGTLVLRATLDAAAGFSRLAGAGRLEVTDGRVHGFSLAEQVLGELAALPLIVGQLRGKDLTPYFEEEFDLLSATFRLENHELVTDDLTIVQDYTRAELRGRVDLVDGALALSGRLVIGEELDAELSGAQRGREKVIPIAGVGGTVTRPKLRLDRRALAEVASTYVAGGRMREELEEQVGPEGAEALQDLLEKLLQGGRRPQ